MSTKKSVTDVATALTEAELESKRKAVPTAYQKALGKLTIEFSFLHFSLERFSWKIWNLTGPMAQILTKDLQLKHLAIKLRASAKHAIPAGDDRNDFISILKRVEDAAEQRNEFLHSLWLFPKDGEPVVCVSRRRGGLEGPDAPSVDQIDNLTIAITEIIVDFIKFKKRDEFRSLIANFGAKAQRGKDS